MSGAYYNEFDPFAAQWLRNLIKEGHIAAGEVDERSIVDVKADDLKGFTQCHFFAGIGGWSLSLRLAGWEDSRPAWTGSCPCQPFSAAGNQKGQSDERHLWPVWFNLIRECKPKIIFGEQVASAINMGISDEEMFCMLNPETPDGIQKIWGEVKGWSAASMLRMSATVREEMAIRIEGIQERTKEKEIFEGSNLSRRIYQKEQGSLFNFTDQNPLPDKENSVRSRFVRERNIRPHFIDALRSFWLSAEGRSWEARLQQRFDRQDQSEEGVYLQQHQDSLPRDKCSDGGLGAGKTGEYYQTLEGLLNELRGVAAETGTEFTGKTAYGWWDDVAADLEAENYAVGSAVLPACSVGKPHRRDRLWFVADASGGRRSRSGKGEDEQPRRSEIIGASAMANAGSGRVYDERSAADIGPKGGVQEKTRQQRIRPDIGKCGEFVAVEHNAERRKNEERHAHVSSGEIRSGTQWVRCADGKKRLVESAVRFMVDGIWCGLDDVSSKICKTAEEEIEKYGKRANKSRTQALQMVWNCYGQETLQTQQRSGVREQFPEKEVLFTFLFRVLPTFYGTTVSGSIKEAHGFDEAGKMRSLRLQEYVCGASCERQSDEQLTEKPADALRVLSLFLACCAEAIRKATESSHARPVPLLSIGFDGRVGALRGLGNAIVPALAAEVIKAFMEIE